ncbi:hypothetical protein GGF44_000298 [Coemansia sp. RSA 1694]|nr:hypothetical protein GGF44_000298 [Coemansia sp. RSA 1694]
MHGGSDVRFNIRLAAAIKQARQADMPKENIERAINRATSKEYTNADHVVYEGLGPHGVALVIECLTDNKNRTVKALRNKFNRMDGVMTPVGYMFDRKGRICFTASEGSSTRSFDAMFDHAIDVGAEDVTNFGSGRAELTCQFTDLSPIAKALSEKYAYAIECVEGVYLPNTAVNISDEQAAELEAAVSDLEELDDVIRVFCNASST